MLLVQVALQPCRAQLNAVLSDEYYGYDTEVVLSLN